MTVHAQLDFFGTPLPGLQTANDFLSAAEEARLIERVDGAPLAPFKFQQWEGKRLTASYGWSYDFSAGRIAAADRLPDWLLSVRDRAAGFAGLPPDQFVQALLIRYDAGAGIGWHRDRPVFGQVIGILLGASATMRFRRRTAAGFERAKAELAPRSIYHLEGEARQQWEHSIAPMDRPRWSITFRTLA